MNYPLIQRRAALGTVVISLCVGVLACGSAATPEETATMTPPPAPSATPVPTEPPAPTDVPASVAFQNNSGFPICGIYIIPTGSEDWGQNMVDGQLEDGNTHHIDGIPPGMYDTLVTDCQGNVVSWWLGNDFPVGGSGTYPVNVPEHFVTLSNNSSLSICGFYAIPVDAGDYPRNLIVESMQVAPSTQFLIALDPGDWNIKIESCQDDIIEDLLTVNGNTPYDVTD